jgi:exopolysaccharide production protein ExoQ
MHPRGNVQTKNMSLRGVVIAGIAKAVAPQFEKVESNGVAFGVGFFFSFRLFIMLLSVRLLGTDPQTGVEVTLTLNFLLLVGVVFDSLGVVYFPARRMVQQWPVRWALMFLFFSGCSLLWSGTASLPAAIAYWCAMASDVAIVILMLRAGNSTQVANSLMRGYVWGACAVAIIAWLLPAQSDLRLGDEDLVGPNAIGYLCAFALFFAQYLIRETDGKWGAAALLLGVTLLRSLSKTTIIAFLAAEAVLLLRDKSMRSRTKLLLALGTVAIVAAFSSLLYSYYDIYTNAGNQAETLTGRLGLWTYFLAEGIQQPWIGHGFHSVWKVVPPFGGDQFEARHAHNELLQQFYAYGVVGVCMFAGIYGGLWLQLRKLTAGPRRTFFFALILFVLIRGLADTDAFDLSLPLWSIILISMLAIHADAASKKIAESASLARPASLDPAQRLLSCADQNAL